MISCRLNLATGRICLWDSLDGRFERHFRLLAGGHAANKVLLGLEAFTHRPQGGAAIEVGQIEVRVETDGLGVIGDGLVCASAPERPGSAIATIARSVIIRMRFIGVLIEKW